MKIEIPKIILEFWSNVDKVFYFKPFNHPDIEELFQLSDGTPIEILYKDGVVKHCMNELFYSESEMLRLIKLKIFI